MGDSLFCQIITRSTWSPIENGLSIDHADRLIESGVFNLFSTRLDYSAFRQTELRFSCSCEMLHAGYRTL